MHLVGEWQGVPGGAQEDGDAAGEESLRQALARLAVARQDEAEQAAGHSFHHRPVRLDLQLVHVKLMLRARHLFPTMQAHRHQSG